MTSNADILLTSWSAPWWPAVALAVIAGVITALVMVCEARLRCKSVPLPLVVCTTAAIAIIAGYYGYLLTVTLADDPTSHDKAQYLALELHDTYDLVALAPVEVHRSYASVTARTSDGHDVHVELDWSTSRPADPDATAYVDGMDLPKAAQPGVHMVVTVNGDVVDPGPLVWDEETGTAVNVTGHHNAPGVQDKRDDE